MSFRQPDEDAHPVTAGRRFRRDEGFRLPGEVIGQLRAAEQLCEELEDSGYQLRFEQPGVDGMGARVRAVLVDADGNRVRDVRLTDVVSLRVDPEAA